MTPFGFVDDHLAVLQSALADLSRQAAELEEWGRLLAGSLAGGRLLIAGNGGSAAEAQHLSAELVGRFEGERRPLSALVLHGDTSSTSAICNDYGRDEVYARQVEAHGRAGDVLLLLTTSGRSSNLLSAAERARALGISVWALTGPAASPLAALADRVVSISSTSTSAIQEAHLVAVHAICAAVERHLAAPQASAASVGVASALAADRPEAPTPTALRTERALPTPPLARRAGLRLLVVGDALLDRDIVGRSERLAPDAPVPVVDVHEVHDRPGGAGLAAQLAVRSGVEVVLATGLGQDAAGRRVRELLAAAHVEVHDVVAAVTTPGKTRVRVRGQSLLRVDDAGHLLGGDPNGGLSLGAVGPNGTSQAMGAGAAGLLEQLAEGCDAVLVADYGGAVTRDPGVRTAIGRLTGRLPVVWDPHPRGLGPVPGCAAVTPNLAEALGFSGAADEQHAAQTLSAQWQAPVTVTLGDRGVLLTRDADVTRTPAQPCPPAVDTCGAGDRYAGSLALALAAGSPLEAAVASAVRDVGAWLAAGGVSADQGVPAGSAGSAGSAGVDSAAAVPSVPASADEVVADVRARGGSVVATGGCFDVLHAGHLAMLQAARALGDALVVLVNSDASVRRLKGAGRPVHTAADRARLLEALSCVDAVAVFEDDDPVATLDRLQPDVWVKGGDYTVEALPEAAVIEAYGGRVVLVPYLEGHSTTRIVAGRSAP